MSSNNHRGNRCQHDQFKAENLKYHVKTEHEHTTTGFDRQVQENAPYRGEVARLRNEILKVNGANPSGMPRSSKKDSRVNKIGPT
ncbi:hypothetical protein [Flagellimonas marinaquae]|uniref:hypothetical protein n=1 Tax=Flagellimonas marinaquae TaxID=254955 RepID=UPI002075D871|nr:hypothetical protein [Allomuricauda aquimarina]USD25872.1 hypothetical protein MJO53_03010 [Allomuricauda aquimarina]